MKYIYTGRDVISDDNQVIVKSGDTVEGEIVQLAPAVVLPCFAPPCPTSDALYGLRFKNDVGEALINVDDLTRADGGMMDEKGPTGFFASISLSNKGAVIAGVIALLFLIALFFNKQIRSFFTA